MAGEDEMNEPRSYDNHGEPIHEIDGDVDLRTKKRTATQNEIQHINVSLDMMKDIMGEQLGNIMSLVGEMSTEDILGEQAKHSLWIMAINDELNRRMSGI